MQTMVIAPLLLTPGVDPRVRVALWQSRNLGRRYEPRDKLALLRKALCAYDSSAQHETPKSESADDPGLGRTECL